MKKIYTLIATTLMIISAYAAPTNPLNLKPVKVSDEAIARSQMRLDRLTNDIRNNCEVPGLEQHDVEIDGLEFTAYLLSHGPATRVANSWEWGERLYDIDFILSTRDNEVSEYYVMSVLWPTYTILSLFEDGEENMKIDNTMVSPAEMLKMSGEDYVPFKFIFAQPGYVNIASFTEDSYVDGWFAYSAGGKTQNKSIRGVNKGATLTVNMLNLCNWTEDVTLQAEILDAAYNDAGNNNVIDKIDFTYTGKILDMHPGHNNYYSFDIAEVHITNTGTYYGTDSNEGIESNWNYYSNYFPKLKRFYINMCTPNMAYYKDQWQSQKYPYYHADESLGLGKENEPLTISEDTFSPRIFIQGSLWLPEDTNLPFNNEFTQVPTYVEYPRVLNTPEPYTTQEAWMSYCEFAILDGMTGACNGEYVDYGNVKLSIRDELTFYASGYLVGTSYYGSKKTGTYFYHYDPTDYSKYEIVHVRNSHIVESILNDNIFVGASDGKIKITCDGSANVVIYNLAGGIVERSIIDSEAEFAANPGVYVVKVGEKSHKVIL